MTLNRVIGLFGLLLCGLALFANRLGLDNDSGWGRGRLALLLAGLLVLALSFAPRFLRGKIALPQSLAPNEFGQTILFSSLAAVVVIAAYAWFLVPKFEKPGNAYYSQLAASFKQGHLYLPQQPSPELLALENPYDYEQRKQAGVEFLWDISLYEDRYYLYWGPVPSLLLAPLPASLLARIGDQHMVFLFACGLFLYSALLILALLRRRTSSLPPWMIGLALLAVGLSVPLTMMFASPRIYEAAVIGCQMFFIGGCFWACLSLRDDGTLQFWTMGLAALHWAFAVGTRLLVLPAVGILAFGVLIFVWRKTRSLLSRTFLSALFSLGIPLFIGAGLLGWYNWARFDSVFEIGMKYQLLFVDYSQLGSLFAPWRIPGNFLEYFLRPYDLRSAFPFIAATENTVSNNKVVGLLLGSPYLWFFLHPLLNRFSSKSKPTAITDGTQPWLVPALTVASLASCLVILSYFFVSMNYAVDFTPSMYALATIFLGQGYGRLGDNVRAKRSYLIVASVLIIVTVASGLLLALPAKR